MKRLLIVLGFMVGFVTAGYCEDWAVNTSFAGLNDTITISSSTVAEIVALNGYREVMIGDPDVTATIFYRVDGSTINIPTVGWWIPAGEGQTIKFNKIIYLQLKAGVSSITARIQRFWR